MTGEFVEDRFEARFELDQPRENVWASLERETDGQPDWLSAFPRFPGFEVTGEVIEVDPPTLMRVRKTSEPCIDTEIAVSLESTSNGTRILVVQSGFPAEIKNALDMLVTGGQLIMADLMLYLRTGVSASRQNMPWALSGMSTEEVDTGLRVVATTPETYAARAGLEAGDLLVTLGGAPVFTNAGLHGMLRLLRPGSDVDATWVRGRELLAGTARL